MSSLVHSSTLVTAGVFLLIRREPTSGLLFEGFIWVPCITLLFSCLRACLSFDLKRVIAMSTLGHLSLIFLSLFLGYSLLSYFHLLTHALFKSLLFIRAGNAINFIKGSQDIRDMGGLLCALPIRRQSIILSVLSLMGFPFSSGFFSKDIIVEARACCLQDGNFFSGALVRLSIPISIFYRARLCYFLFCCSPSFPVELGTERNCCMVGPLTRLGVVSVCLGSVIRSFFVSFDFVMVLK